MDFLMWCSLSVQTKHLGLIKQSFIIHYNIFQLFSHRQVDVGYIVCPTSTETYWYGLFSLLCVQCSVLFCDIVLLCVTVFLPCISLFIFLVLYCVCLWCTYCYPNWGFSVLFPHLWGKCQNITPKDGARPALSKLFLNFFIVMYVPNFFIVICVPFSVFCVLFVCKCVLYCCHRVSTQLQLNIYNIKSCRFVA
jgi:hypothetical protein